MIKIIVPNIDKFASFHYNRVAVKSGKAGKAETLIQILDDKIRRFKKEKRQFFIELKKDIELDFDNSLITGKPNILRNFIVKYERDYPVLLNNETFRKYLLKIFFYETYDKWDAYALAADLNITVCPYCNRQYTFTIGNTSRKGTRPQFDHFFDKATYPYLALSFYNLIPSCNICNSNLKGSEKFDLDSNIHPYIEGFDERLKFSIKPKNISFLNGVSTSYRIKLKLNTSMTIANNDLKKMLKNSIVFRLNSIYNKHKDYVDEIIQKSIAYNDDYYIDLFNRHKGTLFNSIDDVKKMVLSNYITKDELGNRILAKLTKDIAEELGIL
jgi:hypothetical protein